MRITVEDVIRYAAIIADQHLATMAKAKPFVARPEGGGITFVNHKGKERANGPEMLEKYVTIFNRQPGVFTTGAYVEESLFDSSYFLTLVARMIDDGEYEYSKARWSEKRMLN